MRSALFLALLVPALAQVKDRALFLPPNSVVNCVRTDSEGAVYLAGLVRLSPVALSEDFADAFLMKVAPDLSEVIFTRIFAGSGTDDIRGITVGEDGSIYATGTTFSPDFPAGSSDDWKPGPKNPRGFVLKLNPEGQTQYARYIPGQIGTYGVAIAVNQKGETLISGQTYNGGVFPTSPGVVSPVGSPRSIFLLKLDQTGQRVLLAITGFGPGPVAYGPAGDLYVTFLSGANISPTPGAFQATHGERACSGTAFLQFGCSYQAVSRISADGQRLLYSTFVTGTFGAQPAALLVDANGNALLAGSTFSSDYPVTSSALQTEYRVTNYPPPATPNPKPAVIHPPSTGYLTKVNGTGTDLVWSTFFSGTGSDSITDMRFDTDGNLVIAGLSGSRDLPGATPPPSGCNPGLLTELTYVAHLTVDASAVVDSRYVYGFNPSAAPRLILGPHGQLALATDEAIRDVPSNDTRIACVADNADGQRLSRITPGQLITLFGSQLGEEGLGSGKGDRFPVELGGMRVQFNGIDAPLVYTSPGQVNLQVPFEIAGLDSVDMTVTTGYGATESRTLGVTPQAPSLFLAAPYQPGAGVTCNGSSFGPASPAFLRNEDGSQNTSENPARAGSIVTLFLNGLGVTDPPGITGAINASTPAGVNRPVFSLLERSAGTIVVAEPDPGSISSVWRLKIQLGNQGFSTALTPLVDGQMLRVPRIAVWVSPAPGGTN